MKVFYKILIVVWVAFGSVCVHASEIRVAVTTSFNNSGLADVLLPEVKRDLALDVRLLIVGTGQALRLGRAGDVDAILVHSRKAEKEFVKEGFGTHRREIMYNDFVVIGPKHDPADVRNAALASEALQKIKESGSLFVSRGDDSGTHKKEQSVWNSAGLDTDAFDADWYRSVGAGMGAALNTAAGMNAYILSDRATWLKFGNKGDLSLLFAGDPALFNQYAFLAVSPDKHPHVKHDNAMRLEKWLVGSKAQEMIRSYKIDNQALFVPNAKAE